MTVRIGLSAIVTLFLFGGWADAAGAAAAEAAVHITGDLMDANGQTTVPVGLLGVHAFKMTPENIETYGIEAYRGIHFIPGSGSVALGKDGKVKPPWDEVSVVIDCQGDRYCPALCLKMKNFEPHFARLGRDYARKCKEAGWRGYAEFWNEPYLNWAERSHGSGRNNYNPEFYDRSKAVDGGPVTIKGWDEPLDHLRWRRLWARGEDGKIYYGVEVPREAEPGDTFRGHSPRDWYWTDRKEQTFTVVEQWGIYDADAEGWWSGPQNCQFYLWMFLPWAKAIKETNPEVQVLAGWDFGFSHGDWAVWRQLVRPVLDAGIQYIDGVTDHHYGTDSRLTTAWYETAVAYTVSHHGKWIKGFNTECGGRLDPAVYGADVGKGADSATYVFRDVLELMYHSPAKSGSRTAHHPDGGVLGALKFMKDLRGALVASESTAVDLWPVASVSDGRLVVLAFSSAKRARQVEMRVTAPEGAQFRGGRRETFGGDGAKLAARGREFRDTIRIGPMQVAKLVFDLRGKVPEKPGIERRQFFAKEILREVEAREPLRAKVEVDPAVLRRPRAAWLQVVFEGNPSPDARLKLNGAAVDLPEGAWTMRIGLDPQRLRAANVLEFTSAGKPYQVDAISLVLDAPAGR